MLFFSADVAELDTKIVDGRDVVAHFRFRISKGRSTKISGARKMFGDSDLNWNIVLSSVFNESGARCACRTVYVVRVVLSPYV